MAPVGVLSNTFEAFALPQIAWPSRRGVYRYDPLQGTPTGCFDPLHYVHADLVAHNPQVPFDFTPEPSIAVRAPGGCVAGGCRDDAIIRAVGSGSGHGASAPTKEPTS